MKGRLLVVAALLGSLPALGGEIVFTQPGQQQQAPAQQQREPSRSERELDRAIDKARQKAGKSSSGTAEGGASQRPPNKAEQASQEAQDYLRPGGEAAGTETTTVILRNAPPSDAEKARLKARGYIAPANAGKPGYNCGEAATAVGMIGEGPGAERSANVFEKGNASVNTQCK
ncbi:hypothetical protein RHDC4_00287 [Rhodocyclaceae bacterium]|nr:hypothetical protein RHDC4_00287 [Rhodocyclaceae bacterium]